MRHCEPSQILNRFPIQNRREQARQQSSAGTARPPDKACKPPPRRRSEREVGNRLRRCESSQILNRFPIQNRRDQARQQSSADTARPTKRASRHHGGAASGKLGTGCRCEPTPELSRFSTQFRATKRGSNRPRTPSARPTKRASRHHGGAASGKLGTMRRCESSQILNRFPIQNRRDQTRQQGLAGTARLDGEKGRVVYWNKKRRTLCGLILTTIHSR